MQALDSGQFCQEIPRFAKVVTLLRAGLYSWKSFCFHISLEQHDWLCMFLIKAILTS